MASISEAACYSSCVFMCVRYSTPGVNFINVQRAAFAPVDPKSVKDTDNLTEFLRFWELRG